MIIAKKIIKIIKTIALIPFILSDITSSSSGSSFISISGTFASSTFGSATSDFGSSIFYIVGIVGFFFILCTTEIYT